MLQAHISCCILRLFFQKWVWVGVGEASTLLVLNPRVEVGQAQSGGEHSCRSYSDPMGPGVGVKGPKRLPRMFSKAPVPLQSQPPVPAVCHLFFRACSSSHTVPRLKHCFLHFVPGFPTSLALTLASPRAESGTHQLSVAPLIPSLFLSSLLSISPSFPLPLPPPFPLSPSRLPHSA